MAATENTDIGDGLQKGVGVAVFDGSHNDVTVAVTFPTPYGAAPSVVANADTDLFAVAVTAVTTTGCTIHVWYTPTGNAGAATVNALWQAMGLPGT